MHFSALMAIALDSITLAWIIKSIGNKGMDNKKRNKTNLYANQKSKFHNVRIQADGKSWASKWEYQCWKELRDLEIEGVIKNLKTQVKIKYAYEDVVIWTNIYDFEFEAKNISGDWEVFHADAKSVFSYKSRTWQTSEKIYRAWKGKNILVFLNKKSTDVKKSIYKLFS